MVVKINPSNERVKCAYVEYVRRTKGYSESTIDGVLKSIRRYEDYTGGKDFKQFSRKTATGFIDSLKKAQNAKGTAVLSVATIYSTINQVKSFFAWLAGQPGYRSKILLSDIEYFGMTLKDKARAKAPRFERVPTIEQIRAVVTGTRIKNEIDRRDQALIAFTLLTGARASAICSAKIGHVFLDQSLFFQDGRDMNTKFSKTIQTTFFPVGGLFLQIVVDWINYLLKEKLWCMDDPLFPANKVVAIPGLGFQTAGLACQSWKTASAMRTIFKARFTAVGLPYYNPHSFRKTVVRLGERLCKTPAQFKAWSQNIGHESMTTTFTSYGVIPQHQQAELITQLGNSASG